MWIFLLCLKIFLIGVSCADKCDKIKNILAFTREPYTLDFYQEGVEENILIDDSGKDLARIDTEGKLKILDNGYKGYLTSKGFSFQIKNAIEGKRNFTASVTFTDGTHCVQHYHVTVSDDQICSKIKEIRYKHPESYITLDFDSHGVEEISWFNGGGWTIAVTKDKAKLQILYANYEGSLSVINISLRIHQENINVQGNYTARVSFRNGTQCLQRYFVTTKSYQWYKLLQFTFGILSLPGQILLMSLLVYFWQANIKLKHLLKEQEKNEQSKQNRSEYEKVSYSQLNRQDGQDNVTSQTT